MADEMAKQKLLEVSPTDRVLGKEDAPITIIEYASLTCPHCADFHEDIFPKIKEHFVDTGKVRFVFRDFPFDEPGLRAAMLARCAPKERYFVFLKVLFSQQDSWSRSRNFAEILENIAKLGGMSGETFHACMANKELETSVSQSRFDASKVLEVKSTPSVLINGALYKGGRTFKFYKKELEKILNDNKAEVAKEETAG